MADIFVSYTRTDQDRVAPIVALLKAHDWSVWWDERINAGEQWDEVIEREVSAASCVVTIWSFQSVNSRWVRAEASEGHERRILVPVLIDATRPPLEFKRVQSIDLTGWKGGAEEHCAKTLIGDIARFLGHPPVDAGYSPAKPQAHGQERSRGGKRLVERWRDWTRFAALLAGRYARAAKARVERLALRARIERLALRARMGRRALRDKLAKGTAVAVLPALAAAIVVVASALWLTGWLGGSRPIPSVAHDERSEIDIVLEMAERRVAKSNIMGARRILTAFESIAPGSIALALGETYDPNMLAAWGVRDVVADAAEAKLLYGRALDLGELGAKKRLDNLNLPELPLPKRVAKELRIAVTPKIDALSPSLTALAIRVVPPEALPGNAFVRLRGLPARVGLTEGHTIAPGSWAVPIFGLASLEAIVPADFAGRSTITIRLVGADGATLAEAQTELVIAKSPVRREPLAGGPVLDKDSEALPTAEPLPLHPLLSAKQRERAERLLARGWAYWDAGQVAAARTLFEPAAGAGLADAAIGMGKTYDPEELARMAVGPVPDRDEAIKWYQRARKLGAREGEWLLKRLERLAVK